MGILSNTLVSCNEHLNMGVLVVNPHITVQMHDTICANRCPKVDTVLSKMGVSICRRKHVEKHVFRVAKTCAQPVTRISHHRFAHLLFAPRAAHVHVTMYLPIS